MSGQPRPVVVVPVAREFAHQIPYKLGISNQWVGFSVHCWACGEYRYLFLQHRAVVECGDQHARTCSEVPAWFEFLEAPA